MFSVEEYTRLTYEEHSSVMKGKRAQNPQATGKIMGPLKRVSLPVHHI
jgi:hypothetical protein